MKSLRSIQAFYRQYPRQMWVIVGIMAIDRLGAGLLFPFLTLYMTRKFNIGMTQVGLLFAVYMLAGFFGSTGGGALSDNVGRKGTAIAGLVFSAVCNLLLGLSQDLTVFTIVAFFSGFFGSLGHPAWAAMMADLLPEEQRSEGYGILRIAANLSITIGPAIGGILAGINFLLLFIMDAAISSIAALFMFVFIRETLQPGDTSRPAEPFFTTMKGYSAVLKDKIFLIFIVISMLGILAYAQMNTTLGVYLRDTHAVPERSYGLLISLNAGMVVLFQYAITRRVRSYPPLLVMAAGGLVYAVGFSMYGYARTYTLFILAMILITTGEMLHAPVTSSFVADLSPEDMRGRYMAVYGLSWMVPETLGVTLGGLVMDNYDQRLLWYFAGSLALSASLGYTWMHRRYRSLAAREPS